MRIARKLVLLATMAVAAMALGASSASAQVEVSLEDGVHCPAVSLVGHTVSGGCALSAQSIGTANLFQHNATGEVQFSACTNVFEARVDESGAGYIYNQQLTGPACGIEPCDEAEGGASPHTDTPWPARLEETVAGSRLHTVFCTRQAVAAEGMGTPCEVLIPFAEIGNSHQYQFGPVNQTPCINLGGLVELSGNWVTVEDAAHPDVELFH